MIKHTELRCGNKVHISGKEDPNERLVATVGEIHYFGSTLECDFGEGEGEEDCDIDHEDLIPIPLSEEWLIRAGFEKVPTFTVTNSLTYNIGRNRQISVSCVGTPNEMVWISYSEDNPPKSVEDLICIRNYDYDGKTYLHHIQNIVKDFCGEELTFKDL